MSSLHKYLSDMLTQTGVKYETDDDGDVKMVWEVPNGRSQIVFIDGTPDQYGPWSDFDVWSPIGRIDEMDAKALLPVLQEGGLKKVGGALVRGKFIIYKVDLPVGAPVEFFKAAITAVALTADELEQMAEGDEKDRF